MMPGSVTRQQHFTGDQLHRQWTAPPVARSYSTQTDVSASIILLAERASIVRNCANCLRPLHRQCLLTSRGLSGDVAKREIYGLGLGVYALGAVKEQVLGLVA
jgi:hypothetical protein